MKQQAKAIKAPRTPTKGIKTVSHANLALSPKSVEGAASIAKPTKTYKIPE